MFRTLATVAFAAASLNAAAADDDFRNLAQSFERGFGATGAQARIQADAYGRNLIASFERATDWRAESIATSRAVAPAPGPAIPPDARYASARGLSRR